MLGIDRRNHTLIIAIIGLLLETRCERAPFGGRRVLRVVGVRARRRGDLQLVYKLVKRRVCRQQFGYLIDRRRVDFIVLKTLDEFFLLARFAAPLTLTSSRSCERTSNGASAAARTS